MHTILASSCSAALSAALLLWPLAPAQAQAVKVGAGAYQSQPRGSDAPPPPALWRTEAMAKQAAPTNQWYSALVFAKEPEVLYAQPLTVKATTDGLEMAYPSQLVVPTERKDTEIHYPHTEPLRFSALAFKPERPKLARASDWAIDIAMGQGTDQFTATVAHGSPYVQMRLSRGDLGLALPAGATAQVAADDARQLHISVGAKRYAAFGPTGVRWESSGPGQWVARLPAGKGYVAAAALPDDSAASLALVARHAYAFLTHTEVQWRYDQAASEVQADYRSRAEIMEGLDHGPLLALYPHHWFNNASLVGKLGPAYTTIRGPLKLLAGAQFSTRKPYHGFVPFWPKVEAGDKAADLADVLKTDQRNARRMMLEIGKGAYWQGKGLQRIVKLMDVVEQQGDTEGRDKLLKLVQGRFEEWLSGRDSKTYFHLDTRLGTVVAYPDEYFAVEQMNDHHFHYGYWIRAAAEVALRDPAWVAKERWGGMIDLLVADIATTERGGSRFPFVRNFDVYEGHSWASGVGLGPHGNNQESSSEAINAWIGLILWGEVTGNTALRDLGAYLYSTEVQAINHYWFDIHGLTLPAAYKNVEVSMVFGGRLAHNTWWTDEPRQIKGINLLPITTASAYLATSPSYVKKNLGALKGEMDLYASRGKRADPPDIWQDIFAKYMGLADPAAGLAQWNRWGAVELGDSRSHALHMLLGLRQWGAPDLSVKADTPLYAVFKQADGRKTYMAFNPGKAPLNVKFSDGKTLSVAPGSLAQASP
ncbi:glycosyl hydrolase [Ideonella sp.]|jgi:endoglucanase Acf2|uniref:glycosyl hydrolase n=1 Tax=Ideonella sp. TaxID=1929293 RepID=UPI0037BF6766